MLEADSVTPEQSTSRVDEVRGQSEPQGQTDVTSGVRRRGKKRNIIIFTVVSILNAGLLVLLWTQLLTPAQNVSSSSRSGSTAIGNASSPLIGKPAPDFTLKMLDGSGKTLHLADLKGKPVMLNFWASWCVGCQQEVPFLQQNLPNLQKQGVVFVGIDGQEGAVVGQQFVQDHHLTSLNVQDTTNGDTAISYGVTGFPETVFIDRSGVVVGKWIGPLDQQAVQNAMAKMQR